MKSGKNPLSNYFPTWASQFWVLLFLTLTLQNGYQFVPHRNFRTVSGRVGVLVCLRLFGVGWIISRVFQICFYFLAPRSTCWFPGFLPLVRQSTLGLTSGWVGGLDLCDTVLCLTTRTKWLWAITILKSHIVGGWMGSRLVPIRMEHPVLFYDLERYGYGPPTG